MDFLADSGGDLVFNDDIVIANSKEAFVQFAISVLRTMVGDNRVYPTQGTRVPTRHGLSQSRATGDLIKRDIEQGLVNSGVSGIKDMNVVVLPTGETRITSIITLDVNGIAFDEPVRINFDYNVGTGEVERLNGVIE